MEKHTDVTRRGFLTTAATGLVTAGLAGLVPGKLLAGDKTKTADTSKKKIITRKLGKTDLTLPIVSMGSINATFPGLIEAAYEAGIRHIDTAAGYQFGRNEQMIGTTIERMKVRDKFTIGTKVYLGGRREAAPEELKSKFRTTFEGSLKRLKTEYVDILYLHDAQSAADPQNPATMEILTEMKKEKKARYIGIATHTQIPEIIENMIKAGIYDVLLVSMNLTMDEDDEWLRQIKNAADAGIGIIAMKTMAGGSRWPNADTRRQYSTATIARASLKWVMRHEHVTTCIPGFATYQEMEEDVSVAYDLDLTDEEKNLLSDNNITYGLGFCKQCRTCLASCPDEVDIPKLMRTHMYAAQYGNLMHARATLDEIPKQNGLDNCLSCDTCQAQCANSVDIDRRIRELKSMYA
ncbi:MAG: aldo/keto reductase [candidate division Zixibacteria bacterium]|nr:aldo/keto reductase [candidate division Zixibacteria bacterium]